MLKSAHQVFLDYLQKCGKSMTAQRAVIVNAFLEEEGHFSSEQLYAKVRNLAPGIGQVTVYRTLKLLVGSGLADSLDMGDGVALYEHGYGHAHHDHLVCQECGYRIDIVDANIEKLQECLAEKEGFTLTRHQMLLFGLCPECRKQGKV